VGGPDDLVACFRTSFAPRRAAPFVLDVDVTLPAGITVVLGESGAGKTTLLHSLLGLVRPDRGVIRLGTRTVFDSSRRVDVHARERRIGLVFQDLALFPHLDVRANVSYGLHTAPRSDRQARVDECLDNFHIGHLVNRKVGTLSGGERQRVAFARSLVVRPDALLLDEALSSLDGATKSAVMADFRIWNAEHRIPVVHVTHSLAEARTLGERVVVLHRGAVVAEGAPEHVLGADPGAARDADVERLEGVVVAVDRGGEQAVCLVGGRRVSVRINSSDDVQVGARLLLDVQVVATQVISPGSLPVATYVS
jgi:ABC-type molybdate transport system ATPase subunit